MGLMVVLVMIVPAFLAYVVGRLYAPTPTPEPKRFGLNEAEAALSYVKTGGAVVAQSILGVVVGVLGYENTVADDVKEETGNLAAASQNRNAKMSANEEKIRALRAEIDRLRTANGSDDARTARLREIAEIFRG